MERITSRGVGNRSNSREDDGKCRNCGGPYPHKDSCPAKNKKCKSCGKLNHFARVCRTNPPESAKHVTFEDTAENDEYVYTVGGDKQQTCKVKIDGKKMEMMVKIINQVKPDETCPQSPITQRFRKPLRWNQQSKRKSHQASHWPWRHIQATTAPSNFLPSQKGCRDGVKAIRRARHRDRDRPNALSEPYCHSPQEVWSSENMCRHARGQQDC